MEEERKKVNNRITLLGFIMTCVIVLYHCREGQLSPTNDLDATASNACIKFIEQLGGLAMCYFFSTTGFLLFRNFTKNSYYRKLRKRVLTLLVPYFIWQVLYAVSWKIPISEFLKTVFLFQEWPPDGPLWYLYAVFFLALLSPFLYPFLHKKYIGITVFFLVSLIAFKSSEFREGTISNIIRYGYFSNIISYFPAYFAGAFFSVQEENGMSAEGRHQTLCLMILCAVLIEGIFSGYLSRFILLVMPVVLLYEFPLNYLKSERTSFFDISFLMYSTHLFVIDRYGTRLRNLAFHFLQLKTSANLITMAILFFMTVILSCVIKSVLCWGSPKALSVITGNRTGKMNLKK